MQPVGQQWVHVGLEGAAAVGGQWSWSPLPTGGSANNAGRLSCVARSVVGTLWEVSVWLGAREVLWLPMHAQPASRPGGLG